MPYIYNSEIRGLNFTQTRLSNTLQPPWSGRGSSGQQNYVAFVQEAGSNLSEMIRNISAGSHIELRFGERYMVRYTRSTDGRDFSITHYIDNTIIAGPSWAGTNVIAITFIGVVVGIDGDKALPLYVGDNGATGSSFSGFFSGLPQLNDGLNDDLKRLVYDAIKNLIPSPPPYIEGGTSTTGGGDGTFDDTSDDVEIPNVPALNLSLNHFISTYAPTLTQLNALADFLWSDWLTGAGISKIFADPADAIVSLHMLPFTPSRATEIDVTIGSYTTGVKMDPLTLQFYTINAGGLKIEEYWGNYLDYNPYTKLTLFLPYVGEVTLNPDEVMEHTITIKYRVDALTGAFVCFIIREDKKIMGEYQGNCALEVPISSANYAQLHSALLGLASAAVSFGTGVGAAGAASLLSSGPEALGSAAGVLDSKIRHSHSGAIGSAAGFMGSQKPYLIIERARQCLPDNLNEYAGYPSQITAPLKDQYGFTKVNSIILDGLPLTDGELTDLRGILEGGIYV